MLVRSLPMKRKKRRKEKEKKKVGDGGLGGERRKVGQ